MRRLPIYFLIDVSESMIGTPLEQVQQGMRTIIQTLRVDPYALETAFVSVIAFAGKARMLSPLTELYKFYPPKLPIGGGTSLGSALDTLMDDIDRSVQKTTREVKGDWKPIVFLFTDGNPTDRFDAAFDRWNRKYRHGCNLVAVSIGDNVNTAVLGRLTENVLRLNDTDEESFSRFFKWISASITATSVAVGERNDDGLKLAPIHGINLEKVEDTQNDRRQDENFAVFRARCITTKGDYLIKYARRATDLNIPGLEKFRPTDFKLVGAWPIDRNEYEALSSGQSVSKINTNELVGMPSCPCCGNQIGIVVCQCGGLFCTGETVARQCPWCGMHGELGSIGKEGRGMSRGLG